LDWLLTPVEGEVEETNENEDKDDEDGVEDAGGLPIICSDVDDGGDDEDEPKLSRAAASQAADAEDDELTDSLLLHPSCSVGNSNSTASSSEAGSSFLPTQIDPSLPSVVSSSFRGPGPAAATVGPRAIYLAPSVLPYLPVFPPSPLSPPPARSFIAVVLSLSLTSLPAGPRGTHDSTTTTAARVQRGEVAVWDGRSEGRIVLWGESAGRWCRPPQSGPRGGLRKRDVVLFESTVGPSLSLPARVCLLVSSPAPAN